MVTLTRVSSDVYDQAVEILDAEGSVDLDERTSSWRAEGWSSASAAGGLPAAGAGVLGGDAASAADAARDEAFVGGTKPECGFGVTSAGRDEETIPVVEEQLRVGKRDVNLGRVRVRSYVVEEPVSEEVRLREDRVEIERRPVDRALGAGESAFEDRTIEAQEHAEEAIVSKETRVTEEIGLRRESQERTETVSDRVRRTEVEVEDERDVDSGDEIGRRGA